MVGRYGSEVQDYQSCYASLSNNNLMQDNHDTKKTLDQIFARYDLDKNLRLDYPEVKRMLTEVNKAIGRKEPTDEDIKQFVRVADLNGDGVVSKDELSRVFSHLGMWPRQHK